MKKCPKCNALLETGAGFCEECGTPTLNNSEKSHVKKPNLSKKIICPNCRKLVEADATFCEECGHSNWQAGIKNNIMKTPLLRLGIVAAAVILMIYGVAQLFNNDNDNVEQMTDSINETENSEASNNDKSASKPTKDTSSRKREKRLFMFDQDVYYGDAYLDEYDQLRKVAEWPEEIFFSLKEDVAFSFKEKELLRIELNEDVPGKYIDTAIHSIKTNNPANTTLITYLKDEEAGSQQEPQAGTLYGYDLKESYLIDKEVINYFVQREKPIVTYLTKNGELYIKNGQKKSKLIDSKVKELITVYDNGEMYYVVESEPTKYTKMDFIRANGPDATDPSISEDQIVAENNLLTYFDGKESKVISNQYLSTHTYGLEEPMIVYSYRDVSDILLHYNQITEVNTNYLEDRMKSSNDIQFANGSNVYTIKNEAGRDFKFNYDQTELYYIDDYQSIEKYYSSSEGTTSYRDKLGDLYRIEIKSKKIEQDVSPIAENIKPNYHLDEYNNLYYEKSDGVYWNKYLITDSADDDLSTLGLVTDNGKTIYLNDRKYDGKELVKLGGHYNDIMMYKDRVVFGYSGKYRYYDEKTGEEIPLEKNLQTVTMKIKYLDVEDAKWELAVSD